MAEKNWSQSRRKKGKKKVFYRRLWHTFRWDVCCDCLVVFCGGFLLLFLVFWQSSAMRGQVATHQATPGQSRMPYTANMTASPSPSLQDDSMAWQAVPAPVPPLSPGHPQIQHTQVQAHIPKVLQLSMMAEGGTGAPPGAEGNLAVHPAAPVVLANPSNPLGYGQAPRPENVGPRLQPNKARNSYNDIVATLTRRFPEYKE